MPTTTEGAPASPPATADPIAAAREAFLSRADEVIATPQGPVTQPETKGDTVAETQPGGTTGQAAQGQGATQDAEHSTGQPEPKDEAPQAPPETEPDAEAKPSDKPKTKAEREHWDRLKADPELHDFVQRQLQSTRDRVKADLSKQQKVQEAVTGIRTNLPAFAQDWEGMKPEDRRSWIEAQPEHLAAVQEVATTVGTTLAGDLMDILGADQNLVTPEMLTPEGRDKLRDLLLTGKSVERKIENIRKEAFEAGQSAERAKLRVEEKAPPASGAQKPADRPKTLEEARRSLEAELDSRGF